MYNNSYQCLLIFLESIKISIKTKLRSRTVTKFEVPNIHIYIIQMEYIQDEILV